MSIFNSSIELDCFCYDVIESWISYRKSKNQSVDKDDFMEWVENVLNICMYYDFDDIIDGEQHDD